MHSSSVEFRTDGPGKEPRYFFLGVRAAVNDGVYGIANGHLDILQLGETRDNRRRGDAFDRSLGERFGLGSAFSVAEIEAEGEIARLPARAGEQKITEARKPGQSLRPPAERFAETSELGKSPRGEGGARALAEAFARRD